MKNFKEQEKLELYQVEELESRFEMTAAAEAWLNLELNIACPVDFPGK